MFNFLNKPYRMAILVTLTIVSFSIFVLLDTFVIPKEIENSFNNNSNTEIISNDLSNTTDIANNSSDTDSTDDSDNLTNDDSDNLTNIDANDINNDSTSNLSTSITTPIITDTSYEDENIKISITTKRENNTTYYVADIVLSDSSLLKTAFANNNYGRNIKDTTSNISADNNAILAINGDFYGFRNSGYVLRNGISYRNTQSTDLTGEDLVITSTGDFKIINENETSLNDLESQNVSQVISFGPALVINAESAVDEDDEVGKAKASNPRTAIGQIDTLHYIMIVSDGRTNESEGFSLKELSNILIEEGCITAYNLDGGGSSTMVFNGEVINKPTTNGKTISEREVSDIVYIGY